jgi:hypothetical protein
LIPRSLRKLALLSSCQHSALLIWASLQRLVSNHWVQEAPAQSFHLPNGKLMIRFDTRRNSRFAKFRSFYIMRLGCILQTSSSTLTFVSKPVPSLLSLVGEKAVKTSTQKRCCHKSNHSWKVTLLSITHRFIKILFSKFWNSSTDGSAKLYKPAHIQYSESSVVVMTQPTTTTLLRGWSAVAPYSSCSWKMWANGWSDTLSLNENVLLHWSTLHVACPYTI